MTKKTHAELAGLIKAGKHEEAESHLEKMYPRHDSESSLSSGKPGSEVWHRAPHSHKEVHFEGASDLDAKGESKSNGKAKALLKLHKFMTETASHPDYKKGAEAAHKDFDAGRTRDKLKNAKPHYKTGYNHAWQHNREENY